MSESSVGPDGDLAVSRPGEADARPEAPPASALADDPGYRAAVIDLLGVLAYTELVAFERLAADAALAPTLAEESALALMASAEIRHFQKLSDRITDLGADPSSAMAPFVGPIGEFHEKTAPSNWLESLVKAYVGDGIGTDFYREVSRSLDPETRTGVVIVVADGSNVNSS